MSSDRENNDGWVKGRGAASNPTSRFDRLSYAPDPGEGPGSVPTQYFRDTSRTILNDNDSPDIEMKRGLNVYRGCSHGCIYCYARPTHEYLGLSAGLDFETKLFVKEDAPELLRAELSKPRYTPVPIALSGVTDPYQPLERKLGLTRRCLEVLAETRHPVCVITKNAMVERDMDLLGALAEHDCAWVGISLTTLDAELQRKLEPRASTPRARLAAMRTLADAGVKVGVNVSPIIPGLTDHEIPSIIEAAEEAGAIRATYVVLRLPHGVKELFEEWLVAHFPNSREKVLNRLRQLHGGKLYDPQFGKRVTGEGAFADQIAGMFNLACRKNGISRDPMTFNEEAFRRPGNGQLELF